MTDPEKHKNTRYMALIAFFSALFAPFLFDGTVLESIFFFCGSVVFGYMGITNARDGWGKN
jgi:hypothetical protein